MPKADIAAQRGSSQDNAGEERPPRPGATKRSAGAVFVANQPASGAPVPSMAFATTHIRRAEPAPSATALTRANDQALRRALEQAGWNSSMMRTVGRERGCEPPPRRTNFQQWATTVIRRSGLVPSVTALPRASDQRTCRAPEFLDSAERLRSLSIRRFSSNSEMGT
jgi:hypothetical protein